MIFNGVELRTVHRALSVEKEIPPGAAGRAQETIETADGGIIADERLDAGEYTVRVNIAGRSREEGWAARELLAAWAGSARGTATAELVPTHRPSRCYDARLKSISDPEFVRGFGKVEVRFLLPRPLARDRAKSLSSGAGSLRARIGGSYVCRPILRQTMTANRDGLVWTMDGVPILTLKGALNAGQTVIMDTATESLTIDGAHAEARINVSGTLWRPGYWPGLHEIASTDGGEMEMRWHNEWQ